VSARLRLMRARTAQIAADHPRHVVLAAAVLGLLTGPRMPPGALAATAVAVSMAAVRVPLVRHAPMALGLSAVLLIAAVGSNTRAGALEHTLLGPEFGHAVSGEATVLTAPRDDAFGGRRTLVRWHGEAVLLRLGAWDRSEPPRVGDVVAVRGTLRAPDRTARTARAHAVLRAGVVTATGRRRGGALGLIDGVRRRAEAALAADLPRPEAGLLRGMVLGQDDALPGDVRDAFRAAGLSHLIRWCR
jgi:competence protein ComEC